MLSSSVRLERKWKKRKERRETGEKRKERGERDGKGNRRLKPYEVR